MIDQQKRIEQLYEELATFVVILDEDPLEYGPERITLKFANIDKFAQRLTQIELQLTRDIHDLKKMYTEEKVIYDAKKYKLMATDPRIKVEKTKSEREAAADRYLEEDMNKIRAMENSVADMEIALLSVQAKRKDLSGTESRLRNQMKMIQESLRLNQTWKRNPPPKDENVSTDLSKDLGTPSYESEDEELERFFND